MNLPNLTILPCDPEAPEPLKDRHTSLVERAAALAEETDEATLKQGTSELRNDYMRWLADYETALIAIHDAAFQRKTALENQFKEQVRLAGERLNNIEAAQQHVWTAKTTNV